MDSKERQTQNRLIYKLLLEKPYSRNEIENITGIRINVICWRIHDLLKQSRVAVYKLAKCSITGELVEYLTADTALFPEDNQKGLFD
ncbi:hypothetical protein GYB29_15915 [bacterium]|jgi:hypothetical protein|nr:hypothetical protein [bacterium]